MTEKISDKTVLRGFSMGSGSLGANLGCVDVKNGRVVRSYPIQYDKWYTKEDLNYWTITAKNGAVFEPGFKSLLPPWAYGYKNRLYSKNRVPYPLIREDWDPHGERHPENRGKSKYRRISWDEATDIIAEEIDRIDREYGNRAVLLQGDGHGQCKAYGGGHGVNKEMYSFLGGGVQQTRNADSWEGWYWGAKHIWGMDPVGQSTFQTNLIMDIANNSDAVLWWGADTETTPWGWGGQQASRVCYFFTDAEVKQIWIAPDVNYASCIHADKWIPVLPNTDAALQLAIAYVWMTEGTYDKDYLDTHATGFDWFEYYVLGNEDGIPKTPEWASEKCGTPVYTIKALARYWAKHNVSIGHCNGGSYIRSCFAHEPARLEVALLGMQALGHPGRNFLKMQEWTLWNLPNTSPVPVSEVFPTVEGAYHGHNRAQMPEDGSFIPKTLIPEGIRIDAEHDKMEWYGHTLSGAHTLDQLVKFQFPTEPHSGIRMIWSDSPCWTTCWNGGNELQDALTLDKVEFVLVQHPWMENDTVFADIILPVSTKFELSDIGHDNMSGQWSKWIYEAECVEPECESVSDYVAVLRIAKKLEAYGGKYRKLKMKLTKGRDKDETLKFAFNISKITEIQTEGWTWEDFKERQLWMSPTRSDWQDLPAGMINFYNDPEGNPLTTPTHKLEYYSTALAAKFPDDQERPPVPHWVEESPDHHERISSDRAKDYPFLLVSNHPRWRVHANNDDIPWLREIPTCKIAGPDGYLYEPVWVNPVDAEKLGIEHGDVVEIYNERGTVMGAAYITNRIMPGAVYQDHGARVDSLVRGAGGLDRGGANNLVAPKATTSKNCAGEVTSGFLVGLRKADLDALKAQYPEEFAKPYDPAFGLVAQRYLVDEEV